VKLLFFVNHLRSGAGMINRVIGLAKELSHLGHRVSLLGYFAAEPRSPDLAPLRYSCLYRLRYRWWLYEVSVLYPITAAIFFWKLVRERPDIVFVELHHEAMVARWWRWLYRYRIVFTYHGVADSKFYTGAEAAELERIKDKTYRELRQADQVIVVSRFLKRELEKIGLDSTCIYNGVEEQFVPQKASSSEDLLFVGRFTEYKGALNVVKAFVKAAPRLGSSNLCLRGFCDRPSYLQEIKKVIRDHGLEDRCSIGGPVAFEELPHLIRSFAIFINGSENETFGMPLIEAQACGVPVIAFAAAGIPEVVLNGKTGLLAKSGDLNEMAAHIERLANDSKLREAFKSEMEAHSRRFRYPVLALQLLETLGAPKT
jgi:glycosyltransferase involved in cell wall biosynthesis